MQTHINVSCMFAALFVTSKEPIKIKGYYYPGKMGVEKYFHIYYKNVHLEGLVFVPKLKNLM